MKKGIENPMVRNNVLFHYIQAAAIYADDSEWNVKEKYDTFLMQTIVFHFKIAL